MPAVLLDFDDTVDSRCEVPLRDDRQIMEARWCVCGGQGKRIEVHSVLTYSHIHIYGATANVDQTPSETE